MRLGVWLGGDGVGGARADGVCVESIQGGGEGSARRECGAVAAEREPGDGHGGSGGEWRNPRADGDLP